LNSGQQHQHYDVIVVNPASSTYIKENKTHLVTGAAALRAHNMKIRKYAQLINKDDFHPMVFETLGYWTEEVTKLINICCQIIAEKEGVSSTQLSLRRTEIPILIHFI